MGFKFTPNTFAKDKFNLKAEEYIGDGLTYLFKEVLGEKNYSRYMIAQAPFYGNETEANINIITNPDELNPDAMVSKSIGTVSRLDI